MRSRLPSLAPREHDLARPSTRRHVNDRRRSRPGRLRHPTWAPGKRVLIYIRVSKVGDRTETLVSPDVQKQQCRQWAEREQLIIVGNVVVDLDESGRSSTTRQIDACIDRVRDGEIDGIVVWRIDRWGPNLVDAMRNVMSLHDAGGFIASATENLSAIHTPGGKFSLVSMLALAELQSDQIRETWLSVHAHRLAHGLPQNGGRRFGYNRTRDPGHAEEYTPDPNTAPWLRHCYQQFAQGAPANALAKELNATDVPTTRGGTWTPTTLLRVLDSGFGAGLITVSGTHDGVLDHAGPDQYVASAHEPIIDRDEWEAFLAARKRTSRASRPTPPAARLSGLLRCGTCGRSLVPFTLRPAEEAPPTGYECNQSLRTSKPCPAPVSIRRHLVEQEVEAWLKERATTSGNTTALEEVRKTQEATCDRIDALRNAVSTARAERVALLDAVLDDARDISTLQRDFRAMRRSASERIDALSMELAALENEAPTTAAPSKKAFQAALRRWNGKQPERANHALRTLIREVRVHRTEVGASRQDSRLTIVGCWDARMASDAT